MCDVNSTAVSAELYRRKNYSPLWTILDSHVSFLTFLNHTRLENTSKKESEFWFE